MVQSPERKSEPDVKPKPKVKEYSEQSRQSSKRLDSSNSGTDVIVYISILIYANIINTKITFYVSSSLDHWTGLNEIWSTDSLSHEKGHRFLPRKSHGNGYFIKLHQAEHDSDKH